MRKADFESTTKRKDEIRANMSDEFSLIFDSFLDLGGMAITASGDRVTNVGSSAVSEVSLLLYTAVLNSISSSNISDKEGQRAGSV